MRLDVLLHRTGNFAIHLGGLIDTERHQHRVTALGHGPAVATQHAYKVHLAVMAHRLSAVTDEDHITPELVSIRKQAFQGGQVNGGPQRLHTTGCEVGKNRAGVVVTAQNKSRLAASLRCPQDANQRGVTGVRVFGTDMQRDGLTDVIEDARRGCEAHIVDRQRRDHACLATRDAFPRHLLQSIRMRHDQRFEPQLGIAGPEEPELLGHAVVACVNESDAIREALAVLHGLLVNHHQRPRHPIRRCIHRLQVVRHERIDLYVRQRLPGSGENLAAECTRHRAVVLLLNDFESSCGVALTNELLKLVDAWLPHKA